MKEGFNAATRRDTNPDRSAVDFLRHYRPQILVCTMVVALLFGGALYAARISESAPKVVYSVSLDEIATERQQPLKININTADVERLDKLPEVGPATAQSIVDYRTANGLFKSVDELHPSQTAKAWTCALAPCSRMPAPSG
jgi:competence protein ComEA